MKNQPEKNPANPSGKKPRNPHGRPTKYRQEFDDQAYRLCLCYNSTMPQLAEYFEVNTDTIYEWRKNHASFSDAIYNGKEKSDFDVTKSLRARAVGYEYTETKTEGIADPNNPGIIVGNRVTKTTKQLPPDTAAAFIWLKNRMPKEWRDRKEIEHKSAVPVKIDDTMSDADIEQAYQALKKSQVD